MTGIGGGGVRCVPGVVGVLDSVLLAFLVGWVLNNAVDMAPGLLASDYTPVGTDVR